MYCCLSTRAFLMRKTFSLSCLRCHSAARILISQGYMLVNHNAICFDLLFHLRVLVGILPFGFCILPFGMRKRVE